MYLFFWSKSEIHVLNKDLIPWDIGFDILKLWTGCPSNLKSSGPSLHFTAKKMRLKRDGLPVLVPLAMFKFWRKYLTFQ